MTPSSAVDNAKRRNSTCGLGQIAEAVSIFYFRSCSAIFLNPFKVFSPRGPRVSISHARQIEIAMISDTPRDWDDGLRLSLSTRHQHRQNTSPRQECLPATSQRE
jgi:hypothetical protein